LIDRLKWDRFKGAWRFAPRCPNRVNEQHISIWLAAAGAASVLVPFPHAVDDHQTHNARFLSERGAAVLVPQRELTPQRLADLLRSFSRSVLLEMAQQARSMAKPEATQSVVDECDRLAA